MDAVASAAAALRDGRGVIVCGRLPPRAGLAEAVSELAARLDAPVLADPLSGLRFGPHDRARVLTHYDLFLARESFVRAHRPDWVLQLGGVPTSRALQDYVGSVPAGGLVLAAGGVNQGADADLAPDDLAIVVAGDAGVVVSAGGVQTELPGERMAVHIARGNEYLPGAERVRTWYEASGTMSTVP